MKDRGPAVRQSCGWAVIHVSCTPVCEIVVLHVRSHLVWGRRMNVRGCDFNVVLPGDFNIGARCLQQSRSHLLHSPDDGGGVFQYHPPYLPVLTRGDVSTTVVPVLVDDVSEESHLLAGGDAVGELETHHETTVCDLFYFLFF